MVRLKKETRIVSVCILGPKAKRVSANRRRAGLLRAVAEELASKPDWGSLDAVVFPGGFFRLDPYIGHLTHVTRVDIIGGTNFHDEVMRAQRYLAATSPGVVFAIGVDSNSPYRGNVGDQLCVAWNTDGIAGIGRKVFPVDGDTNGELTPFLCHGHDYGSPNRFVGLPSGETALLGACYDLFGIGERADRPSPRHRYIRYIQRGHRHYEVGDVDFRALRGGCIAEWQEALTAHRPTVVLGAIHKFQLPGRELFWQRHGIARASAVLSGGLVVAAAHFTQRLPEFGEAPLAAAQVEAHELHSAQYRKANFLAAIDAFVVRSAGLTAFVRLYRRTGR